MTTGNEEKVAPLESEEIKEETIGQTEIPTQEEIDRMLAEARKKGEDEAWQKYQGIQKAITKQDRRLKQIESLLQNQPQASRSLETTKSMIDEMESSGTWDSDRVAHARRELTNAVAEQQRQTQVWEWEQKIQEEREKLYDTGVTDDAEYDDVWEAFEVASRATGNFDRVHRKAEKILKSQQPKEIKETTVKDVKTLEAEYEKKFREKYKIDELLKTDNAEVVGTTGIPTERAAFNRWLGNLPDSEYEKNRDKIQQMLNEGKIK